MRGADFKHYLRFLPHDADFIILAPLWLIPI